MIIFDASTLILLAKTDLLELFISNYPGPVLIPEEVRSEILEVEKADAAVLKQLIDNKMIKVTKIRNNNFSNKLMEDFNIEKGEAEALGHTLQEKAGVMATDDRNAMRACKFLKIEFITTISILIRSFEKGLINSEEALIKLKKLQFLGRYSKTIIADAAEQLHGRKG